MSGRGELLSHFNSAALEPTAAEVLSAFEQCVSKARLRPSMLSIDTQSAVKGVARVLKGVGIAVGYYPPPSPEETELINKMQPPTFH